MIAGLFKNCHSWFRMAALILAGAAATFLVLPSGDAASTSATPTGLGAIHVPSAFFSSEGYGGNIHFGGPLGAC